VCAAADEGFLAAQFMLGLAHLEGREAEKDAVLNLAARNEED